jgi:hypothetical protein
MASVSAIFFWATLLYASQPVPKLIDPVANGLFTGQLVIGVFFLVDQLLSHFSGAETCV